MEVSLKKTANARSRLDKDHSALSSVMASNIEQSFFLNTLGTLFQAEGSGSVVTVNKIFSNVRYMSFALAWFGLVRIRLYEIYICL